MELLAIERNFLENPEIKQALQLGEFKKLKTEGINAQKKKFITSLKLSSLVASSFEWFQSEEGKSKMNEEGISWNAEEFASKVFGYKKSFFYRLVKVGKLDIEVITSFDTFCTEQERSTGNDNLRNLQNLLKFAKDGTLPTETEESEESGEDESEESGEVKTVFVFTYKNEDGKNVSVRILSDNTIKTTNENAEISEAFAKFTNLLNF